MSIKTLPSMEHVFKLKIEGSETGQMFEGTFRYRRPNIRTQSEISKTKALLDGGLKNLDEDAQYLHMILANLKHTIQESPEWWQRADFGYDLYDFNVLTEIYKECAKFESDWFDKVWSEDDKKKETPKAKEKPKAEKNV